MYYIFLCNQAQFNFPESCVFYIFVEYSRCIKSENDWNIIRTNILIGSLNNGFVSTWPFTPRAVADGRGKSGCKLFQTIDRSFRLPDGI